VSHLSLLTPHRFAQLEVFIAMDAQETEKGDAAPPGDVGLEEKSETEAIEHGDEVKKDVELGGAPDGAVDDAPAALQLHWNTYAVVGSCAFGIFATIVT
jgi:hypothetical protein